MRSRVKQILFLIAFVFAVSGCGASGKSDKTVLTVLTEPAFEEQVSFAANYMMQKDPSVEIQIRALPFDIERRENQMQRLRTEIMSGKGPDVYLLATGGTGVAGTNESDTVALFDNPYKIMQSGALAPLDQYMKADSYWEKGTYKKEFLPAGQSQKKQYIIPLSCNFEVRASANPEAERFTGETLTDWLKQAESSSNPELKMALRQLYTGCEQWFQPAVDYDAQTVQFDKEKWKAFALDYWKFCYEYERTAPDEESAAAEMSVTEAVVLRADSGTALLQAVPDIEGRKVASIESFGAVGMSCERKKEAYDFLMLFLNDEMERHKKEQEEFTPVLGLIDMGIPVQDTAFRLDNGFLEPACSEFLREFRTLDGAYFPTEAEDTLSAAMLEAASGIYGPSFDLDYYEKEEFPKLLEKVWNQYYMLVFE